MTMLMLCSCRRQSYWFVPTIESPGVAFIVVGDEPGTQAKAIFDSVLQGWPVLVLTVVMAVLAGIIMWGLVSMNIDMPKIAILLINFL